MIFIILLLIVNVSFSQDKGKTAYENGNYNDARLYYENILRSRENDNAAKYGPVSYTHLTLPTILLV